MTMAFAHEAAELWGGHSPKLLRDRENAVFRIERKNGPAALRLHRQGYQTDAAIWSELWWCAALASAGVAVPAAIPSDRGDLFETLSNGRRASVIEWVPGDPLGLAGVPFDRPKAQILTIHENLGALVRRFHDVTASLILPLEFSRPRWDIDGLVGDAPFWGAFWTHPNATADQRRMLMIARDLLRDCLTDHARSVLAQPIHADVLRENVLVTEQTLSLIDFDDSGWGFPLYDLGTCMSQNLNEPARDDIFAALCQGYGTNDLTMVKVMTLARTCASVGWTMPRLAPDDPIHGRHLARACDWTAQVLREIKG